MIFHVTDTEKDVSYVRRKFMDFFCIYLTDITWKPPLTDIVPPQKLCLFPSTASGNRPNFGEINYALSSHLGVIYILTHPIAWRPTFSKAVLRCSLNAINGIAFLSEYSLHQFVEIILHGAVSLTIKVDLYWQDLLGICCTKNPRKIHNKSVDKSSTNLICYGLIYNILTYPDVID